jgi:hypothetical protein
MAMFFELRALAYFALYFLKFFLDSGLFHAVIWTTGALVVGVLFAFFTVVTMPRVVEDYVKIYNWYINSDFYVIFEEKIDVRLIFKLLFLPILLAISLLVAMMNLVIRLGYQLAFKLDLLRCVYCSSIIEWNEGTVLCHICGEKVTGNAVKTCPGCNFKANAIRCPFCGYVVFVGLVGHAPVGRTGKPGE